YNNAFIAYRNALHVYEQEYASLFNMQVPEQLKKDLMNTAYWTGFNEEFEAYKTQFNMSDYMPASPEAELVFFWHNGLAPIKDEWSINFVIDHQSDNLVACNNESLRVFFPCTFNNYNEKKYLSSLDVFRVAFPKYVERPTYFTEGILERSGESF